MNFSSSIEAQSLESIRRRTKQRPALGIILGSGLGDLAKTIEDPTAIPYDEIPGFPRLSAAGHAGELIIGNLGSLSVVAMRGRAHLYEGHDPYRATYGVRVMRALGAQTLIVSNAAGGLNPRFCVGDLVILDGHLDLMHRSGIVPPSTAAGAFVDQSVPEANGFAVDGWHGLALPRRSAAVYDPELIAKTLAAAQRLGFSLDRGTYLATLGPTYETRAEYRAFRLIGADMVGMSTVPETILAASLGLKVLAFSVITNVAAPDSLASTSHDDVLVAAGKAQFKLIAILKKLFDEID